MRNRRSPNEPGTIQIRVFDFGRRWPLIKYDGSRSRPCGRRSHRTRSRRHRSGSCWRRLGCWSRFRYRSWFGWLRFNKRCYRPNQNPVVRIDPVWIDDVFVLLPKLRPQPWVLQNFARNPGQDFALLHEVNLKLVRVRRIPIRTDVPVRTNRQGLRRWTLFRSLLGWGLC